MLRGWAGAGNTLQADWSRLLSRHLSSWAALFREELGEGGHSATWGIQASRGPCWREIEGFTHTLVTVPRGCEAAFGSSGGGMFWGPREPLRPRRGRGRADVGSLVVGFGTRKGGERTLSLPWAAEWSRLVVMKGLCGSCWPEGGQRTRLLPLPLGEQPSHQHTGREQQRVVLGLLLFSLMSEVAALALHPAACTAQVCIWGRDRGPLHLGHPNPVPSQLRHLLRVTEPLGAPSSSSVRGDKGCLEGGVRLPLFKAQCLA